MKLRSAKELKFRAGQESANLWSYARPPRLHPTAVVPAPLAGLPHPDIVASRIDTTEAAAIREHRFRLLGYVIETGQGIHWRRDYLRNIESGLGYFRGIPYLDVNRAGDHKLIWELNRHQHLIVLAADWRVRREAANLREIVIQTESWLGANPFERGINWTSALEVAFRALSWIWVYHLCGEALSTSFREDLLNAIYAHACFIRRNLSVYFSPNTHLLGEAVALAALGNLLPHLREAASWRRIGCGIVQREMERQVRADGSHIEQSAYYQAYAVDMFGFFAGVCGAEPDFLASLRRMGEFLRALEGPARRLPLLGDDDGGYFFNPYPAGSEEGEQRSQLFQDAGVAVLISGGNQVLFDAGPFGPWPSGHSHSDTLSVVARRGAEDIVIDCGTFTYVADSLLRDYFRGSAAHNTIRINRRDQAIPAGPFAWSDPPVVNLIRWNPGAGSDQVIAECSYRDFVHRREVIFEKPDVLHVIDTVEGPGGQHEIEQFWHLGSETARSRVVTADDAEEITTWRSHVYGEKHLGPALLVRRKGPLPMRLVTRIDLAADFSL